MHGKGEASYITWSADHTEMKCSPKYSIGKTTHLQLLLDEAQSVATVKQCIKRSDFYHRAFNLGKISLVPVDQPIFALAKKSPMAPAR